MEGDRPLSTIPNHPTVDPKSIAEIARSAVPRWPMRIARMSDGVSTVVYRIVTEGETFYLRILPEEGASFAPEAEVHRRLRQLGAKVPDVVYFEHRNDLAQRSVMVTTEIRGQPIGESGHLTSAELDQILTAAGEDVARINSLSVDGFGWIKRGRLDCDDLRGESPSYRAFALGSWESDLRFLRVNAISSADVMALERVVVRHGPWLDVERGCLAHGDLDTTHIYHHGGRYSGIIDFGEIRGADRWYDLGHFHLRDGERLPPGLGAPLAQGYARLCPPSSKDEERIRFSSILINVRALANSLQKNPPNRYTRHQVNVLREDLSLLG